MGWINDNTEELLEKFKADPEYAKQYYEQAIEQNKEAYKLQFSDYILHPIDTIKYSKIDGEGLQMLGRDVLSEGEFINKKDFEENYLTKDLEDIDKTRRDLEIAKVIKDQAWQDMEDSWKGISSKYFQDHANTYTEDSAKKTVDFFNSVGVDLDINQVEFITRQLDEEEWKKSEYYREGMEFQPYWTMNIAREKANNFDLRQQRQKIIDEGGVMSQIYGLGASIIPVLASPSGVAMVGVGTLLAPVSIGGALVSTVIKEGIGMAAGEAIQAPVLYHERGMELTNEEYKKEIAHGALIGSIFGLGHYGISKIINKFRAKPVDPKTGVKEISTEEIKDLAFENAKISEQDKIIDAMSLDNQLRIANGDNPLELELKSNEYYDISNGNERTELPTRRVNLNSSQVESISNLGGRWRVVEAEDLKTTHNFENGKLIPNAEYQNEIFKKNTPSIDKINIEDVSIDRLLKKSDSIHDGFPIIDKNGNVLIGNEKALAIKENYVANDMMNIKKDLIARGFKEAENMERPTLMFELTDELKVKDLKLLAKKEVQEASEKSIEQLENAKKEVLDLIKTERAKQTKLSTEQLKLDEVLNNTTKEDYSIKSNSIDDLEAGNKMFQKQIDLSKERLTLEKGQEKMELFDARSVAEANEQEIFKVKRIKEKFEQFIECIL